ncbi:MAG: hypothetical protein KAY39_03140, partial [Burkholderiaceae bacterium]|nr:hypothetical protein [Burkholderiaceae bacterium]
FPSLSSQRILHRKAWGKWGFALSHVGRNAISHTPLPGDTTWSSVLFAPFYPDWHSFYLACPVMLRISL